MAVEIIIPQNDSPESAFFNWIFSERGGIRSVLLAFLSESIAFSSRDDYVLRVDVTDEIFRNWINGMIRVSPQEFIPGAKKIKDIFEKKYGRKP